MARFKKKQPAVLEKALSGSLYAKTFGSNAQAKYFIYSRFMS